MPPASGKKRSMVLTNIASSDAGEIGKKAFPTMRA
jgi:hypothetical protein